MLLGEFFTGLSYGELNNLSMSSIDGPGTIQASEKPRLTFYTQQALTTLYTRFAHRVDYILLAQMEGIQRYAIRPVHAVTNAEVGNTEPRFLIDTAEEPFEQNILKIISVTPFDDVGDIEDDDLVLNGGSDVSSIKTLTFDELYITTPVDGAQLLIEYQARHKPLDPAVDESDEIVLLPVLERAMECLVAAKVFGAMNGVENYQKSQTLEAKAETIFQMVNSDDLLQATRTDDHDVFTDRGFV